MTFFQINSGVEADTTDAELLARKVQAWNSRKGPRVGDFVLIGDRVGRFSHAWGDGMQWSEGGSFFFAGAYASFSGGLNPTIPFANFYLTEETRDGNFWFFHHDSARAHNGVGCRVPCRVYRAKTKTFKVTVDGNMHQVEAVDRSDAWSEGLRRERKAQGKGDYWYPTITVEV